MAPLKLSASKSKLATHFLAPVKLKKRYVNKCWMFKQIEKFKVNDWWLSVISASDGFSIYL